MSKQDRQGARTAAQLEQKYHFGESFAEAMGLAKDAQKTAEEAKKALDETLTQEEIFNILTNNGQSQGLYRGDDGELYINALYIVAGILKSLNGATSFNLNTGALFTEDTSTGYKLELDEAKIRMSEDGKKYFDIYNLGFGVHINFWNPETGGYNGGLQGMIDHVRLNCGAINPGKKVLFTGNVAAGSTFDVPNTANYDLFAVKLGTSSTTENTVVMAYKVGDTIRGVGGWSGDATQNIKLFFLSATFSGNTWTLADATSKELAGTSVGSAVKLNVKEVVGVI